MATTQRDKQILIEQLADVIDGLRPITQQFPESYWRPVFEREVAAWRAKANGQPEGSDYARECNGYAVAHQMFLDGEVA